MYQHNFTEKITVPDLILKLEDTLFSFTTFYMCTPLDSLLTIVVHFQGQVFRVGLISQLNENTLLFLGDESDPDVTEVSRGETLDLVERVPDHVVTLHIHSNLCRNMGYKF